MVKEADLAGRRKNNFCFAVSKVSMVLGFHFQGLRPSYSIAENTYEGTGTRARKGPKGSRALPSSLDGSE